MITRRHFAVHGSAALVGLPFLATSRAVSAQRQEPAPASDVLRVGPTRQIKTIRQASQLARPGMTIEVDAGDYVGDVATWAQDDLRLRAIGGRVRLRANGVSEGRKGIWVVRARRMLVEGFDFEDAVVPDHNGAGIRLDQGSLRVRDCRFLRNQMGLLTNNDADTELVVENCEFAYNQRPDGHNHNLYVGRIARLSVTGSYFHHAHIGHLLKTRAAVNHIQYNRLTDEVGGTASYELEFPNGGVAYVVGNIIEQSAQTENQHLISFGAEGYAWLRNAIFLVNNTLVDSVEQKGIFLSVAPGVGAVRAINNLLVGQNRLESAGPGLYRANFNVSREAFAQRDAEDYRLKPSARWVGLAVDPGSANDVDLRQHFEYVHPRIVQALADVAHNPGAVQRMSAAAGQ